MWYSMYGEEILKTLHLKGEEGESLENYVERKKSFLKVKHNMILSL